MSLRQNAVQQVKIAAVAGTTAATNIAVAGIVKNEDVLLGVYNVTDHAMVTDFSITSDGNIQSAATDTSLKSLLVFWGDLSAG